MATSALQRNCLEERPPSDVSLLFLAGAPGGATKTGVTSHFPAILSSPQAKWGPLKTTETNENAIRKPSPYRYHFVCCWQVSSLVDVLPFCVHMLLSLPS